MSLLSLLAGTLGGVIFTLSYNHFYQKSLAVIRLDDILASHLKEQAGQKGGPQELNELSQKYARTLDKVIRKTSKEEKVILLVAPATVTELPDYTERIKREISNELRLK